MGFEWFFSSGERIFIFVIVVIAVLIALYQLVFAIVVFVKSKLYSFKGRHVLITGGSQGLGLCLATRMAGEGAKVTIIARRESVLQEAKNFIIDHVSNSSVASKVQTFSADVTDEKGLQAAVNSAEESFGPVDFLVTCHGYANPKYVFETPMSEARRNMDVNYFGTLHALRCVVPGMMKRNSGEILCVSSQLALCGFLGYAHYSPTKFAIRGLVEVMRNELCRFNIKIHCAYPPGMKTPGFDKENLTKPDECKAIEAGETTYNPDDCAGCILGSVKRGEPHIACGDFGCNMLIRATVGISDRSNSLADALLLPVTVAVLVIYKSLWDKEARSPKTIKAAESRWFSGLETTIPSGKKN